MRVICITQARLGSSRLPEKVLKSVFGRSLLDYHCSRVSAAKIVDTHIVATTDTDLDKTLVEHINTLDIRPAPQVFCGSELNVLDRFYQAAIQANATEHDIIVRLTGDCPLICPGLIDDVVAQHMTHNPTGYTHLSLGYWARGFDVEVFGMPILTDTWLNASEPPELEHVTFYMYSRPQSYPIMSIENGHVDYSQLRLCIDEPDDLTMFDTLMQTLGEELAQMSAVEICQALLAHPEIAQINQHVEQIIPSSLDEEIV